jgi:uncharacterized protein
MGFVTQAVLTWGIITAATALILGPAVWWAYRGTGIRPGYRLLGLAALVYLVVLVLLFSPPIGVFADLAWPWQGKLLALAAACAFVAFWPRLSWRDVGVAVPRPGSWLPVLGMVAGALVIAVVVTPLAEPRGSLAETALFQATMPGLEEELVYRGILWALIARALPGPRTIAGVAGGWSLWATSLMFGLVHGVAVAPGLVIGFEPLAVLLSGAYGVYAGWLRERSGSILPLIVLHNAINLAVMNWGAAF